MNNIFTDSKGYLVDEDGFDYVKVSFLREIKSQHRSLRYNVNFSSRNECVIYNDTNSAICLRCRDYSKTYARSKYYDEAKPWSERCDVAFPCASQNEIDQNDAINLVNSGCQILIEGNQSPKLVVKSET